MKRKFNGPILASTLLLIAATSATWAFADDDQSPTGYRVGEERPAPPPIKDTPSVTDSDRDTDAADKGPVRLARISFVKGYIAWRPSESEEWSAATINMPLREGAQVWVTEGERAEIQFDDGSVLRLGGGAIVTLQTLFSDDDGEFTEIKLQEGLCSLNLRHGHSVYQVDTPTGSVKSDGPAKVRIGVDGGLEIAVREGSASLHDSAGNLTISAGDYLALNDDNSSHDVRALPDLDSWDRWNDERDNVIADVDTDKRLPANIALVAGDLDNYGTWHDDTEYGQVWTPNVYDANWRPYYAGQWTWVAPYGWTWVSSESWGWAPYHYGTWIHKPYGWAWVPGPANQYWCPAVVHFSECNNSVAWAPLAPCEVRYPTGLRVGFRHGNWSNFFSIGGTAVYYPNGAKYCEARPWHNGFANHPYLDRPGPARVRNHIINNNIYIHQQFIPYNARNAAGVTTASNGAFGGHGGFIARPHGDTDFFVRGHVIGAPHGGERPFAGPIGVRPDGLAFTPTHSIVSVDQPGSRWLQRPVVRAPLPPRVAAQAPPMAHIATTVLPTGRTPVYTPERGHAATGRTPTWSSSRPRNQSNPEPTGAVYNSQPTGGQSPIDLNRPHAITISPYSGNRERTGGYPRVSQPVNQPRTYETPTYGGGSGVSISTYQPRNNRVPTYQPPLNSAPVYQGGGGVSVPTYQPRNNPAPNYQRPNYQQPTYQQPVNRVPLSNGNPTPTYQRPTYQQPTYQQPVNRVPTYRPNPPAQGSGVIVRSTLEAPGSRQQPIRVVPPPQPQNPNQHH